MSLPSVQNALAGLPSAFAEACRSARTEAELFDRCHAVLVRQAGTTKVWLSVEDERGGVRLGPTSGFTADMEVAEFCAGAIRVAIAAAGDDAGRLRPIAMPLVFALAVLVELRSVLAERQAALDDATFQLRALRQVSRLLATAMSVQRTEELVTDFVAEVFACRWVALYRPVGEAYEVRQLRAFDERQPHPPVRREAMDAAVSDGSTAAGTSVALRGLVDADAQLAVPLDAGAERVAVLVLGPRGEGRGYGRGELELLNTLGVAAAISLRNAELVEALHNAATTDPLTGLMNRRAIEERLTQELQRADRHHLTTSIVLVDLDRFKAINDTMGHAAGDRVLRLVAQVLGREARALDVVGRLGGDEFVAILPMTTATEARIFAGRVQSSLLQLQATHPELGRCTASLGIAQAPLHGLSASVILAAADLALYKAKHAGRNAIEVAGA
jgi:diguanylate cyclase (GGDEF)-like protein